MSSAIDTNLLQQLGLMQQTAANGTSAQAGAQQTTVAGASSQGQLLQSDFLKLMTTQLKNQDPMNPMSNSQFLGQMAQFGTVSGIQQLQSTIQGLSASLTAGQTLQAASLVGHTALVAQDTGLLPSGGTLQGAAQVPTGVTGGTVNIYDMNGQLVQSMPLGAVQGGMAQFSWDGTESDGSQAPPGQYQVQIQAQSGAQTTDLQPLIAAPVSSVVLNNANSGVSLDLQGIGPVDLSQVHQIM